MILVIIVLGIILAGVFCAMVCAGRADSWLTKETREWNENWTGQKFGNNNKK